MATQLENDLLDIESTGYFERALPSYYRETLKEFKKISRSLVHFNLLFLAIFLAETTAFFTLFASFQNTIFFALSISLLFLTGFSYLVLLFYYQSKKTELLEDSKENFIRSCRRLLSTLEDPIQKHLLLAEACSRLSNYLQGFEKEIYKTPSFLQFSKQALTYLSSFFHFEDVFQFKIGLLQTAVEEHLSQIRITPTDLEVHASLANTYVTLAGTYKELIENESHPKASKFRKKRDEIEARSQSFSRLAIEEFKILEHYATNDPWVHEQMAVGYRELNLPNEEIKEMETLLELRPHDKEILFRLGALYFSQKMNAKGLTVYEKLKKMNYKKAEALILSYGAE